MDNQGASEYGPKPIVAQGVGGSAGPGSEPGRAILHWDEQRYIGDRMALKPQRRLQQGHAMDFAPFFDEGYSYLKFLERYGSEEHRRRWQAVFDKIALSESQRALLRGFQRELKVLCMAGAWCGDCVQQCPIFERFAEVSSCLTIRFVDRDEHQALADELTVCGGARVPAVVFLSEDGQAVGRYGDRTLSKYRQMADEQLGASCPTGISPPDQSLLEAVTQDWLNEFERVQLILRMSPRLREKHGD